MNKNYAPILITAYNRYINFKKLINSIKFYKSKIYISIDGPKNSYDKIQQLKIVNLIKKNKKIHKIKYRILNENLGCQKAVFSSLEWFFLQEEKGIILEDDTLPSKSFFKFCNELLIKFSKDKKVFSISGHIPFEKQSIKTDYFFSKIFMCWGWATWKSRWLIAKKFTPHNRWQKLLKTKEWNSFLTTDLEKKYFRKIYKKILLNHIDSWAYLWLLFGIANKSKFILPKLNLVKNTGTQTHGANNVPSKFDHANSKICTFTIARHPLKSSYSKDLDSFLFNLCFRPKDALYPWRILFLIKCLFLDPMFFLKKVIITIKKNYL
jgi:hypothetical protein